MHFCTEKSTTVPLGEDISFCSGLFYIYMVLHCQNDSALVAVFVKPYDGLEETRENQKVKESTSLIILIELRAVYLDHQVPWALPKTGVLLYS